MLSGMQKVQLISEARRHPPKTDIIILKKIITMGEDIIHRSIVSFLFNNKNSNPLYSMILILLITGWAIGTGEAVKITTDNTCTFRQQGKLFSLVMLNKGSPYEVEVDDGQTLQFNFCEPFIPTKCNSGIYDKTKAYSYLIKKQELSGISICEPYSSDSKTHNFAPSYSSDNGNIILTLTMQTQSNGSFPQKSTDFVLDCVPLTQNNEELQIIDVYFPHANKVIVYARTPYACPVFQISSIWKALTDNLLIFGFVLFIVGFIMLFFGILMTHLMIFIAAYFLSFAGLTGIFTAFLGPNSSTLIIYFSLLLILFLSTLIAYCLTRLVNVSVFLIGAFLGFILAAIVNTIFCKIIGVYPAWSLIFFEVALIIPFGLLTFKYSKEIIVMSTSLTGAYMVVRPFSWIFGGFPNEFTLSDMINSGQLQTLPWTFFLYLIAIIAIAILGGLYQILKLKRKTVQHVESNFITQNVEQRIDRIKQAVENIINRYAPDSISGQQQKGQEYSKMKEMNELRIKQDQKKIQQPSTTKQRKSKEEYF